MQVLLRKSKSQQNLHCTVCGQGFRLYWEASSPAERATMRNIILGELRDHHSIEQSGDLTSAAHPADLFHLPGWPSPSHLAPSASPSYSSRSNPSAHNVVLISSHAK
jgi:hypothetical protein